RGEGPPLSEWEQAFLEEVEARIETYGSAFADLDKGPKDEALSMRQAGKLREISKKARGLKSSGFKRKPPPKSHARQLDPDLKPVTDQDPPADVSPRPTRGPPKLRVIRSEDTSD
ncbi:MAG: hypothetical protein AAFO63_09860, partial [Pseudomonadota bacterium]